MSAVPQPLPESGAAPATPEASCADCGAVGQPLHLVLGTWWPSIVLVNTVFLVYLALALRRVYGGSWATTSVRAAVLASSPSPRCS